jgi:CRISPR/Cas system CSM-associated protein Csm3 (group 7 of RAMP superfamily)
MTTHAAKNEGRRAIAQRLVLRGTLTLTAPAHFGGGEESDLADMAIVRDAVSGRPLLPGTSIAGALRSFLRSYEHGFTGDESAKGMAELLFGGRKAVEDGDQSPLIVEDSIAAPTPVEVRDGVAIDGKTRIAIDNKKYDIELLPVGTQFPLCFELLLPGDVGTATKLQTALALALDALSRGAIGIGARSARGYGDCRVTQWSLSRFDLTRSDDLLAYLVADHSAETEWQHFATVQAVTGDNIADLLSAQLPANDQRKLVTLTACFKLASPLLIRDDEPEVAGDYTPDASHIRRRNGEVREAVLPGTSLAGTLRARAVRIANTLGNAAPKEARAKIDDLFGPEQGGGNKQPLRASRLRVSEQRIDDPRSLVQNRVAIDRFTGGALDSALFSEAPLTQGTVQITISVRDPKKAEIGLLLLLLKDLWTGDLPLGGTSSIGRGRLQGIEATLRFSPQTLPQALRPAAGAPQYSWTIGTGEQVTVDPHLAAELEAYVQKIPIWLTKKETQDHATQDQNDPEPHAASASADGRPGAVADDAGADA